MNKVIFILLFLCSGLFASMPGIYTDGSNGYIDLTTSNGYLNGIAGITANPDSHSFAIIMILRPTDNISNSRYWSAENPSYPYFNDSATAESISFNWAATAGYMSLARTGITDYTTHVFTFTADPCDVGGASKEFRAYTDDSSAWTDTEWTDPLDTSDATKMRLGAACDNAAGKAEAYFGPFYIIDLESSGIDPVTLAFSNALKTAVYNEYNDSDATAASIAAVIRTTVTAYSGTVANSYYWALDEANTSDSAASLSIVRYDLSDDSVDSTNGGTTTATGCCGCDLKATYYYVDDSDPCSSDTFDGKKAVWSDGLSGPKATVNNIYSTYAVAAGDIINVSGIHRSTDWDGTFITLSEGGSSGNPVVVRTYPTDSSDAIISGCRFITSWQVCDNDTQCKLNANFAEIYYATADPTSLNYPTYPIQLFENGTHRLPSRFPDDGLHNYYPTNITDTSHLEDTTNLTGYVDDTFNGALFNIRRYGWEMTRSYISDFVDGTDQLVLATAIPTMDGDPCYAYSVVAAVGEINAAGEWGFDPCNDPCNIFLWPVDGAPGDTDVEMISEDKVIDVTANYTKIENLTVRGGHQGIYISGVTGTEIDDCVVQYCGMGIREENGTDTEITNSTIEHCYRRCILTMLTTTDVLIDNCIIRGAGLGDSKSSFCWWGLWDGVIQGNTVGIQARGDGGTISNNTVYDCGYLGIWVSHIDATTYIKDNVVYNCMTQLYDGGGIYTNNYANATLYIQNNEVYDILGNVNGIFTYDAAGTGTTSRAGYGIYLDDKTDDCVVRENYVHDIYGQGIFIHSADAVSVLYNKIENCSLDGVVSASIYFKSGTYYNLGNMLCMGNVLIGACINFTGDNNGTNNRIYNNTIYNSGYGINIQGSGWKVKNNLIYNPTSAFVNCGESAYTDLEFNYNCYYHDTGNPTWEWVSEDPQTVFATYVSQTGGQEANSITTDPKLLNASRGNFSLDAGSSCLNAGEDLGDTYDDALDLNRSQWPSGVVTEDQDTFGAGWEIGADIECGPYIGYAN